VKLYELAFIHKSASLILPDGEVVNNERLEYLGDAILDAIVADYLFKQFPNKDEGFLTQMRSKMVKRKHLNLLAYRMGLNKLIVSHTHPANISKHLYGNAFEALVGAIYLDKGFKPTAKFIERTISRYVDIERLRASESDYKSKLIEWAQKTKQEVLFVSHEETPAHIHSSPHFVAFVRIVDKELGRGIGKSKKEAEQKAARIALDHLDK
jgi:ribonuclease-3